jgi:hypothetical protein
MSGEDVLPSAVSLAQRLVIVRDPKHYSPTALELWEQFPAYAQQKRSCSCALDLDKWKVRWGNMRAREHVDCVVRCLLALQDLERARAGKNAMLLTAALESGALITPFAQRAIKRTLKMTDGFRTCPRETRVRHDAEGRFVQVRAMMRADGRTDREVSIAVSHDPGTRLDVNNSWCACNSSQQNGPAMRVPVALIAQFRLRMGSGDDARARMMTFIVDGV